MCEKKKERAKLPTKTAEMIDETETLKYRAAALMKRDSVLITSEMSVTQIADIMDKYMNMAEEELDREKLAKVERQVITEIFRLRDVLEKLRRDMENLKK